MADKNASRALIFLIAWLLVMWHSLQRFMYFPGWIHARFRGNEGYKCIFTLLVLQVEKPSFPIWLFRCRGQGYPLWISAQIWTREFMNFRDIAFQQCQAIKTRVTHFVKVGYRCHISSKAMDSWIFIGTLNGFIHEILRDGKNEWPLIINLVSVRLKGPVNWSHIWLFCCFHTLLFRYNGSNGRQTALRGNHLACDMKFIWIACNIKAKMKYNSRNVNSVLDIKSYQTSSMLTIRTPFRLVKIAWMLQTERDFHEKR